MPLPVQEPAQWCPSSSERAGGEQCFLPFVEVIEGAGDESLFAAEDEIYSPAELPKDINYRQ